MNQIVFTLKGMGERMQSIEREGWDSRESSEVREDVLRSSADCGHDQGTLIIVNL